jgi:hypothetical protein
MVRVLVARVKSVVLDEAEVERDFNKSGRIFTALRETMGISKGEQLVRIPLRDSSSPVTVNQVKVKYDQLKKTCRRAAKATRRRPAGGQAGSASSSSGSGSSSSDSDSSGSDSSDESDEFLTL